VSESTLSRSSKSLSCYFWGFNSFYHFLPQDVHCELSSQNGEGVVKVGGWGLDWVQVAGEGGLRSQGGLGQLRAKKGGLLSGVVGRGLGSGAHVGDGAVLGEVYDPQQDGKGQRLPDLLQALRVGPTPRGGRTGGGPGPPGWEGLCLPTGHRPGSANYGGFDR